MQYKRASTEKEVTDFLNENKLVAVDTETTGLNPRQDKLLDVVVANTDKAIVFTPEVLPALKKCRFTPVFHNAKFDLAVLYNNGVDLTTRPWYDTTILDHLLRETSRHGLDEIIQERWADPYKERFWREYKNYQDAHEDDKLEYACKDAIYTMRLYFVLRNELEHDQVPERLIGHVHRLARELLLTELSGLNVDMFYLEQMGAALEKQITELKRTMRESVIEDVEAIELKAWSDAVLKLKTPQGRQRVPRPVFNFESNKQLSRLLYDELKLPAKRNKQGNYTVDDAALTDLTYKHPVVPMVQELRAATKVYGTYIEGTRDRQENGIVYPSFNVNGTVTGRISSSNPNMQQLPRDGGVRGIYVPSMGHVIISCDFGSLEVVIAAHFSQDPNLLKIIHEGASKHDITAQALGIPRQQAKTINFAAQYQCSPYKIAEILGVSKKEAEHIHKKYWDTYAGEKRVIEECKKRVDDGLPIVTPFGRKRRFPSHFEAVWEKEAAYRQAYSALIQGTGADLTSRAFYMYSYWIKATKIGRALFPVHDEIVAEALPERAEEAKIKLVDIMVKTGEVVNLSVPLTAEPSGPKDRWSK